MQNILMLTILSILILIIDAAAAWDIIMNPYHLDYILEIIILILSMVYFLFLPTIYRWLKRKDEKGRFIKKLEDIQEEEAE